MQKRSSFLTTIVFGLALGCGSFASAQVKLISSVELNENISAANEKAGQLSREVVQVDETLIDAVITRKVETTTRFVPLVGIHTRTRTIENGSVSVSERIFINEGSAHYSRENGMGWKKDSDGGFRRMEIHTGPVPFSMGQHTVDLQKGLFESLSIKKEADELVFVESRTWIGRNGLPSFRERIEGKLSPRIETFRSTTRYEYDPSISIEAPIK